MSGIRPHAPYLEVAKMYSNPLLMGPPICDELIALVEHMYTKEEASLVRHLRALPGKTAERARYRHPDIAVKEIMRQKRIDG